MSGLKEYGFFTRVRNTLQRERRKLWLRVLRHKNKNHDFSLITNDCVGGVISHDLGEQFRSPTVNLWIPNHCYLEFVQELRYYLSCDMEEVRGHTCDYPVGQIVPADSEHIPIELHFMHYPTFEDAYNKWMERRARVNYDRLYFIWHFDGNDPKRLRIFDQLQARTIAIVHEPTEGLSSVQTVDCYREEPRNGKILEVIPSTGKRYLDEVDYLGFLNETAGVR